MKEIRKKEAVSPLGVSLSVSKVWKVPPRPRPGRKPKLKHVEKSEQGNKQGNGHEQGNGHGHEHEHQHQHQQSPSQQNQSNPQHEIHQNQQHQQSPSQHQQQNPSHHEQHQHNPSQHQHQQSPSQHQQPSQSHQQSQSHQSHQHNPSQHNHHSPSHPPRHAPGSDCGLCEEGGSCMCDELGIRATLPPPTTATPVMDFENFQPVKAVPLPKRVGALKSVNFKRLVPRESRESRIGAPSEMLGDQGGCGFCSNDTPCLCNDTEQKVVLPSLRSVAPIERTPKKVDGKAGKSSIQRPGIPIQPSVQLSAPRTVPILPSPSIQPPIQPSIPPPPPSSSCTQCTSDPMCSLFCTSLASLPQSVRKFPASIACKDAYLALSRHGKFGDADLGEVVSRLECQGGRVSVGSVSRVLRYLDSV